jgi:hypothetical protein
LNEGGETRRERYKRFGDEGVTSKETGLPLEAPTIEIPDEYVRHWLMFFRISNQVSRIREGVCGRIPPSEYLAWSSLSKVELSQDDYDLLVDMDEAFCIAMNAELEDRRPKPDDPKPKAGRKR